MVGVGKDFKGLLVQHPCHGQGHSPLEQMIKKPVPGIRHPQLHCFVWVGFDFEH